MLNLWYKSAVIYCADVKTFIDSNGDGIGDFAGLTQKIKLYFWSGRELHLADALLPVSP
jgi:hypothetical protein